MGLFEKVFGRRPAPQQGGAFETFTAYRPTFRDWGGQLYESELIRASVDAKARHISKLAANFTGSAKPVLRAIMKNQPNEWQSWSQFLYRTSTILDMQSTAFIVPVFDDYDQIIGFFTVLPSRCELVDVKGTPWLRYQFSSGKVGSLPLDECGILAQVRHDAQLNLAVVGSKEHLSLLRHEGTLAVLQLDGQGKGQAFTAIHRRV